MPFGVRPDGRGGSVDFDAVYEELGRVYKDRSESERGDSILKAQRQLDNAIDAYRRGFEADRRDAYPGSKRSR
jgi:hypothetical protein